MKSSKRNDPKVESIGQIVELVFLRHERERLFRQWNSAGFEDLFFAIHLAYLCQRIETLEKAIQPAWLHG